ncbi:DUF1049 domain-containing protein [Streptomyces sp. NPDC085946]|uniref:DUF1049 domain-containing protein n=1 Tax=Streptomyces sp. NPDC085946 TaxID=3365744 RepID=UPI0037CE885C
MDPKTSGSTGKTDGGSGGPSPTLRAAVPLLAVLGVLFIFQNTRATEIRLLIPHVTMPLWLALLGTGVVGAVCGAYAARRRN